MITTSFVLTDEQQTFELGTIVGAQASPGEIWNLSGDLGTGKTVFVQGFAKGLGFSGKVTSPTFALQNIYPCPTIILYHFDWYRLLTSDEVEALGWMEWIEKKGVILVEWGNKFKNLFPQRTLSVEFEMVSENQRRLTFLAMDEEQSARIEELMRCWPQ